MFKTRLISGIILGIMVVALIFFAPASVCGLVLMAVSLIGMFELYRAVGVTKDKKIFNPLTVCSYIGTICYYVVGIAFKANMQYLMMVSVIYLIVLMCIFVFSYPKFNSTQFVFSFFGYVYLGVTLSFVYFTRILTDGIYIVGLVVLSSWICDVCAYCVGMLIGKHKMAPILSPKKSIEGAVGGMLGSALCGAVYGAVISKYMVESLNYTVAFAVICALGSIASMAGDLCASAIKRQFEIKDYGKLIPGHGGILDRFDSMIVTAPIIYCLAYLFINFGGTK